jgi:hypothetical protein
LAISAKSPITGLFGCFYSTLGLRTILACLPAVFIALTGFAAAIIGAGFGIGTAAVRSGTGFATQSLTFQNDFKQKCNSWGMAETLRTGLQNPSGSGLRPDKKTFLMR